MTEPFDQTALYQKIITKCWGDESFKNSLLTDARATLAAESYNVPDWQTISVVESCVEDEHIFYIPLDKLQLWEVYQPVIIKSYENEDFKAMLLADPRGILTTAGYDVPDGQSITVLQSNLEDVHIFYIPYDKSKPQLLKPSAPFVADGYEYLGWG